MSELLEVLGRGRALDTCLGATRALAIGLAALLLAACHHRRAGSSTAYPCSEPRVPGAAPFDSAAAPSLAGRYRLTTVNTARGWTRDSSEAVVVLVPNDTLRRFYRPGLGGLRRVGDRPLAGRYQAGRHRDTAEVEGRVLYIGCRNCLDGSPTHYLIRGSAPNGFWGTWVNYQTGLVQAVDERGRRLPNPEGVFCAVRLN